MNYKELLNKLIDESGLSNKEILEKCAEYGEKITPNYLSVLKNQDDKIASDSLSIALAKACNYPYEEILIVQAYLDKAPEIIKEYLNMFFKEIHEATYLVYEQNKNQLPKAIQDEYESHVKKELDDMFLAEFICETKENKYSLNLSETLKKQKKTTPIKWALVPIAKNDSIKILTGEDVEEIIL